jgi:hypothetical protein
VSASQAGLEGHRLRETGVGRAAGSSSRTISSGTNWMLSSAQPEIRQRLEESQRRF